MLGIAELVYKVILAWKEHAVNKKRGLRVHVATAYFVPKPHTPFQWEQQISPQEYLRRCKLLKEHFYSKSIEYDYHSPDLSRLEAVFARGDRRLGPVIEAAVNMGCFPFRTPLGGISFLKPAGPGRLLIPQGAWC